MHYDLIIKNGTLVIPDNSVKADIAIENGKIALVDSLALTDTADEVFNAEGLHILPGIIDAHVHFRDPGLTEKEDFESGSAAAAMGGITMIADMPNTIPVTSTVESFKEKKSIANEKSYIDYAFFALLNNNNINEIEGLIKYGALGFKIFLGTSTGDITSPSAAIMFEQMQKCAKTKMRIGFHAETSELNFHFTSLCREKSNSPDGNLLSDARPVISEVLAIQNALCFAKYTSAKVHIHHVTTLDGLRLIEQAKKEGVKVTAETCPHYLLFDADNSVH
jgi:dihydroorotase